ncbi:hypothetical protein BLNAU_12179 [Blattamonas nauphoetae]|uniref:Uncharacterized protein n=1 Tax=Blattamonas nauphoetae TaxID=2049346 RepID=A0ABQ9XKA2_9EUKA|nr:hypothetical protein BLNAU_12179 [Blattamonas nauphoetae]
MDHSSSSLSEPKTKSNPALAKPTLNGIRPAQLLTLPPLLFTSRSHFTIENTTITRSSTNVDSQRYLDNSSVLLKTPITQGILSVTVTVLSRSKAIPHYETIFIGLLDSTAHVPKLDSVSLESYTGLLFCNSSSTGHEDRFEFCHSELREGDCVRMEVDMESRPRTVQFFVNGKAGRSYVSGLPRSVRLGFTVFGPKTSFRIDRITRLRRPTPISRAMNEIKW